MNQGEGERLDESGGGQESGRMNQGAGERLDESGGRRASG